MNSFSRLYSKNKDFYGYFIAAFAGVVVQYIVGTTILLNHFGLEPKLSFAIGFIVSFPVGFFLTKLLAFDARHSGQTKREFIKYMLTVVASGFITVYGAVYSIKFLLFLFGNPKMTIPFTSYQFSPVGSVGHFMGMGMSFVFNFLVHKWFTFNETGIYEKLRELIATSK